MILSNNIITITDSVDDTKENKKTVKSTLPVLNTCLPWLVEMKEEGTLPLEEIITKLQQGDLL